MDSSQGHLKSAFRKSLIIVLATSSTVLVEIQAEETNAPTQLKPTVVTGSLIPTFETITAVPVDVYTIEAIQRSGVDSVQQLIQRLPAISGNASFGDSRGNGGDGSAAVGLRNIPLGTLVLIDGRRVAPNQLPLAGNVDINAIPLAAIDRIEVLKDGASAIYGSDALAGVVNVILKKDFNGTEFSARYGNTFDTDSGEQTYSFVTGTTTEKASILIGGSYYKNNALFSNDREVSTVNRNNPLDFAFGTSGTGNPAESARMKPGSVVQLARTVPQPAFSTRAQLERRRPRRPIFGISIRRPIVLCFRVLRRLMFRRRNGTSSAMGVTSCWIMTFCNSLPRQLTPAQNGKINSHRGRS